MVRCILRKTRIVCAVSVTKTGATLTLKQDIATRWNSSLAMLERLIVLKLPLLAVIEDPATKCDDTLMLTDDQWSLA